MEDLSSLYQHNIMVQNYVTYLNFISEKLERFFARQKPYIFCKKGCAKCCKNAQFPYTLIEITYLMSGLMKLDEALQTAVEANIQKIILDKQNFTGEKFRYDCPFLVNDICCVYEYRGLVCRCFGLMTNGTNGKVQVPFCCFQGLNYSNVMDDDGKKVSPEKFKKLGVPEEPVAFNISYEFLTDPDFERGFNFKFGERKPIIDWFITTSI